MEDESSKYYAENKPFYDELEKFMYDEIRVPLDLRNPHVHLGLFHLYKD